MPLGYKTLSGRSISETLAKYGEDAAQSFGRQLYLEAQGILAMSQGLVPVDTGALRASGYVTLPVRTGNKIEVFVGYGGVASLRAEATTTATDFVVSSAGVAEKVKQERDPAVYAIYVHENLEAFHKVGQAKFLEVPFNMAKTGMAGRIAEGMRSDFSR